MLSLSGCESQNVKGVTRLIIFFLKDQSKGSWCQTRCDIIDPCLERTLSCFPLHSFSDLMHPTEASPGWGEKTGSIYVTVIAVRPHRGHGEKG